MLRHTFTLLCCLLYLAKTGWTQSGHINFTSLTSKDGLVSNGVNAITKDHYGLMWFATDDGLNKFDGTHFTVYRHRQGDSSSLRANEVLALHEDKAGNLWIGTSGGGISLYDRKKDAFIHFPLHADAPQLPPNAVILDISSDTSGNIWIAQFEHLFMLVPRTHHVSKINLLAGEDGPEAKVSPHCLFVDRQQQIWIGTTHGLYRYTPSTGTVKLITNKKAGFTAQDNEIRAITGDSDGQIWVGTATGLYTLQPDGAGISPYHSLPLLDHKLINCIKPDKDHQLWIGTEEGLIVLNTRTNTADHYLPTDENIYSLTNKSIKCIYNDGQDIYWLGTFRGGINKYDKNLHLFNFKPGTAFHENGRQSSIVTALAENDEGNAFVATDGGGMFEFNRQTGKVRPIDIPFPVKGNKVSIMALHYTHDKKLYIGTYALGLLIMNSANRTYKYFAKGSGVNHLGANDIFCIKEDSKGNVWVGTNGEGLDVLKNEQVVARYTPHPNPSQPNEKKLPFNGYIRAIEEDAEGNIWVGSHGGGIGVYHPATGRWDIYTQSNSLLPSDKVQTLLRDSKGRMWIGTFGGLSLFDKTQQRFINFSEKDGLQNVTIYQILEDKSGIIWLSTNMGISSFHPASKKFRNYTRYNGVQNNNFVHNSGIRLSDGDLMFGGLEGINYFTPSDVTVNKHAPVVLLTDLKVSNKSIRPDEDGPIKVHISVADNIRLAYKQNFAISFVALNYTLPTENFYAYKLDGFDKDWNYTGTANSAAYTNLDPGEYTFHVKAANNDGIWSNQDTTIKIYVRPPFWRTIYAYLFYLCIICLSLLYSRHLGIKRIRKKFMLEQERLEIKRLQDIDRLKIKFLTNLSHDFRTPISLIMGPVQQLIEEEKARPRLDKLNMIKRNSRRLLNLVNQLLDFRKMEEHELKLQLTTGDLVAFIKEVIDSFRDFAERKNIQFNLISGPAALPALFDHDKIERILFNLLSNAFKFTPEKGVVTVALTLLNKDEATGEQWIQIIVKDTGIGIPKDKREKIFEHFFQTDTASAILNHGTGIGLSITKEFIKIHGGSIEVESEPGQGATFSIQLPLKAAAQDQAQKTPAVTPLLPPSEAMLQEEEEVVTSQCGDALPDGPKTSVILLVEDNEDFRDYLKDNLRRNYKVIEATNGKEGWQKALLLHPHLIVSDITMPQMDGISLLQKLKLDKRTSHIPVILLTALTNEAEQIAGLATGANDYITKPFNSEILHAKIRNLLHLNDTLKNTYTKQIKLLAPEIEKVSAEEKLMARIASHLEANLTDSQLSVESLSKEVGMSRSSLYNKLLELTGQTPVEYIRSYRLEKAAMLMKRSDLTIAEIAYQVGFSTPNYFAKSFKVKYQMLPSEFMARMQKDEALE
ncbi:two-component regulator propeller domain-containing protein [Chitinophaga sp. Ak27]|uniref:hybrid sensor histidine kinase/response regulator transcription factor n=1 Tax=Chitinophaga sp. Ak27 TaxID=2726116 RepID=UPI00145CD141|nr:two-component regulator propeller domain-containing protein [Chitinophaga sp. Ak27]NLU95354.1 response regulator [Chitinophaga sp. Ak27]